MLALISNTCTLHGFSELFDGRCEFAEGSVVLATHNPGQVQIDSAAADFHHLVALPVCKIMQHQSARLDFRDGKCVEHRASIEHGRSELVSGTFAILSIRLMQRRNCLQHRQASGVVAKVTRAARASLC